MPTRLTASAVSTIKAEDPFYIYNPNTKKIVECQAERRRNGILYGVMRYRSFGIVEFAHLSFVSDPSSKLCGDCLTKGYKGFFICEPNY